MLKQCWLASYLTRQTAQIKDINNKYYANVPVGNSCTSVQLSDQNIFLEKVKRPSRKNRRPTSFIKKYSKCKFQLYIISENVQILCKSLRDWGMRRCFRISL